MANDTKQKKVINKLRSYFIYHVVHQPHSASRTKYLLFAVPCLPAYGPSGGGDAEATHIVVIPPYVVAPRHLVDI